MVGPSSPFKLDPALTSPSPLQSPEIRTAWDPLLANLPVEVLRSHLLECLDGRKTDGRASVSLPYAVTIAAAHQLDDPVCRVLLLELLRVAVDLPDDVASALGTHVDAAALAARPAALTSLPSSSTLSSLVTPERAAAETVQRARVILAQHHRTMLGSVAAAWEAAFPGVSTVAADVDERPVLFDSWET